MEYDMILCTGLACKELYKLVTNIGDFWTEKGLRWTELGVFPVQSTGRTGMRGLVLVKMLFKRLNGFDGMIKFISCSKH